MRNVHLILAVLLSCPIVLAKDEDCKLPTGLFWQKRSLTADLNVAITKGDKTRQNYVQEKIKAIDEQYYHFMQRRSKEIERGELASLNACCSRNATDPIGRLTCRWAQFKAKKISAQRFIEQFPTSRSDREALWMLDQIANVKQAPNTLPHMFGTDGPVSSYITELFTLARGNDRLALNKYMNLYVAADGQYAELMEDQLEHLFLERPDVVLQNWQLIKTTPRALQDLQESLSDEQKQQIIAGTKKYCSDHAKPCQELTSALMPKPKPE